MTEQIFLYVVTAIFLAGGTILTVYLIKRGVGVTDKEIERLQQAGKILSDNFRSLEKVVSDLEKFVQSAIKSHAESTRIQFEELDSELFQLETRLRSEIAEARKDIVNNRNRLDTLLESMQRRASKCATENLTRTEFFRLWDLMRMSVDETKSQISEVARELDQATQLSRQVKDLMNQRIRIMIERLRGRTSSRRD